MLPYCGKNDQLQLLSHTETAFTCLSCSPCVRDGVLRCGRTLGNRDNTILVIGVVLTDAVPVDAGPILRVDQVVRHMHCDCVTPVCEQSWARNGAGSCQHAPGREYIVTNPFTAIAERETPSGATVTSSRVNQYSLVTPVSGTSVARYQLSKPRYKCSTLTSGIIGVDRVIAPL